MLIVMKPALRKIEVYQESDRGFTFLQCQGNQDDKFKTCFSVHLTIELQIQIL
jgi:hypothetical protein